MCGIAGIFRPEGVGPDDRALVARMNRLQAHRGPDDEGLWSGPGCVLGHRRLAIIDLSRDGRQPFASADGRYRLVYNGEIYNYIELRKELEGRGRAFCTATDTEVLLQCFEEYGLEGLHRLNGMFAFALFDTRDGTLTLVRDRFGIKPLYTLCRNGTVAFASEIRALRALPDVAPTPDDGALFDFLAFSRTDVHDETFLREIRRVPKGHYAVCDGDGVRVARWWDPHRYRAEGDVAMDEAAARTEELLVSAATLRMRSDVPVGSCLSGGLDSTILTGILHEHGAAGEDYPTFTAAFPGHPVDETRYVDELNRRYPFASHRVEPAAAEAFARAEAFVDAVEEPTSSPSFYAQYEVMRLARERGVTVLLDGQGGDETFAGYHYFHGFRLRALWRRWRLPALAGELWRVWRRGQKGAFRMFGFQLLPDAVRRAALARSLPWLSRSFLRDHVGASRIYGEFLDTPDVNTAVARHYQYKLEHLLRIEDRTSMAFGLEARVPYLDHRLVEYLLGVPGELKIRGGETKVLQKRAAGRYTVPSILARRDKIGFEAPCAAWMGQPDWTALAEESWRGAQDAFPGVFAPAAPCPRDPYLRWKIIQLMLWRRLVRRPADAS
jgi:asparagine synthase (glutamine-hydrolysing)